MTSRTDNKRGFTLVELLVTIGIIALLIGILLPAVTRMRQNALSVKCKAQLRDIGIALNFYSQQNRGVIYPIGPLDPKTGRWETLGCEPQWETMFPNPGPTYHGRHLRWPNYVFDPPVWNPPILTCPSDFDPVEEHSYILNKHLAVNFEKLVKVGPGMRGRSDSDILVMGEKKTDQMDYYMEATPASEFDRIVEPYRHGLKLGSNYLYLDWHVDLLPPASIKDSMDAWDPGGTDTTTKPTAPPTP